MKKLLIPALLILAGCNLDPSTQADSSTVRVEAPQETACHAQIVAIQGHRFCIVPQIL